MATTETSEKYDDIFDDEGDMRVIDEIGWKRLKDARLKDGFAEGKYRGEESTLQNGFDHGYSAGFELSHSISIIQGLMAVVEMQITNSQLVLMNRSRKLKRVVDMFKERVKSFKLDCLVGDKSVDDDDELFDNIDENSNCYNKEESSTKNHKACYFSSLNTSEVSEKNTHRVKIILEEFNKMNEEISQFISDCNQPAILGEISKICDKWRIQNIARLSPCKTQCTCVNESTHTSCLSVPTTF